MSSPRLSSFSASLLLLLGVAWAAACSDPSHGSEEPLADVGVRSDGLTKGKPGAVNGANDYCNDAANKCGPGEGDCDANSQCLTGLICANDIGPRFGFGASTDVCVAPHCVNGIKDANETGIDVGDGCGNAACPADSLNGGNAFCTASCPCDAKQGDCDSNSECATGLVCVGGVGPRFGLGAATDVCLAAHCGNKTKDVDETGVDCGGADCGACGAGGSGGSGGSSGSGGSGGGGSGGSGGSAGTGGSGAQVTQIGVDGYHTCALSGGSLRCWGFNTYGQLGYGNTNLVGDNETPASAGDVNVGGTVTQVEPGVYHTCAVLQGGAVRCWGYNGSGQLGYGNTNNIGDDETPASAGSVNVGGTVLNVALGFSHTCALVNGGAVRCWGEGQFGELGYGNTTTIGDDETPASAGDVNVGGTVTQISAGTVHTCALLQGGTVRCWGDNGEGQLGYGNKTPIGDDETPASVGDVNVGGTVIQIAAGGLHTCALLQGGTVRCWGANNWGQLGYGNTTTIGDDETPASVGDVNVGGTVIQLAAGQSHTCALLQGGAVRCWGFNQNGQLGYGNTNQIGDDETPASAGNVNVGGTVVQIAAGYAHTCALLSTGAVRCWGRALDGELGYGNTTQIGDNESPASAGNVTAF